MSAMSSPCILKKSLWPCSFMVSPLIRIVLPLAVARSTDECHALHRRAASTAYTEVQLGPPGARCDGRAVALRAGF